MAMLNISSSLLAKYVWGTFFCLIALSACQVIATNPVSNISQEAEKEFQSQINAESLNDYLELEIIDRPSEISSGSGITQFLIKNTAKQEISFSSDYSVRIFTLDSKSGWMRIQNLVDYLGTGEILEPNNDPESNWFTVLSVSPQFGNLPPDALIRIYAAGNIATTDNESGYIAGAYIDLSRSEFR